MEFEKKFLNLNNELEKNRENNNLKMDLEIFFEIIDLIICLEKKRINIIEKIKEKKINENFLIFLEKTKIDQDNKNTYQIQIIKKYSFFVLNLKTENMKNYIFRENNFNKFFRFDFNFENEEIIFFYVNFIKSIIQKLDHYNLDFFYNNQNLDFPLFSKIARFFNYPDNLVQNTVFNSILTLLKKKNIEIIKILIQFPFNTFFSQFISYLFIFVKKSWFYIDQKKKNLHEFNNIKENFFALLEILDDFFFIENKKFNEMLKNQFLSFFLLPIVKNLLITSNTNFLNQNECFLIIYWIFIKSKTIFIKNSILKIFLKQDISMKFNEINFKYFKKFENFKFEFDFLNPNLFKTTNRLINHQLKLIYEKIYKKNDNINISYLSIFEENNKIEIKTKNWHKNFSKKTGIISYYEWEEDLRYFSDCNILTIFEENFENSKNNFYTLFFQFFISENEQLLISFLFLFNTFLKYFLNSNNLEYLKNFEGEIEKYNLKFLIHKAFSENTRFMKITIIQINLFIINLLKIFKNQNFRFFIFSEIGHFLDPIIEFIEDYDLDTKGISKISFYLENQFYFVNEKNNSEIFIDQENYLFFFDKNSFKIYSPENNLNELFLCFDNDIKKKTKKNIFLFYILSQILEKRFLLKNKTIFKFFYQKFYSKFSNLKYLTDENYNLQKKKLFPINLKLIINGKSIKKKW